MALIKHFSVRHKLMLISMAITMAALLLASIAFITSDRLYAQKTVTDSLRTMAAMIGANSSAAILVKDQDAGRETLGFLSSQKHIQAGVLYNADNSVFVTYRRNGYYDDLPLPGPHRQTVRFRDKYAEVFRPVTHNGDQIGLIYLRSDINAVHDRLTWFLGIVAIVLAASLLLAFVLSSQLQRIITDPLL